LTAFTIELVEFRIITYFRGIIYVIVYDNSREDMHGTPQSDSKQRLLNKMQRESAIDCFPWAVPLPRYLLQQNYFVDLL